MRPILDNIINHPNLTANYVLNDLNAIDNRLRRVTVPFRWVPREEHESAYDVLTGNAVALLTSPETRKGALFAELVVLKNGINPNDAFDDIFEFVIERIVKANRFTDGPTGNNQFAEPNQAQRANLVDLRHTTDVGTWV